MANTKRGFTLIELMIVLVIVGILATIAIKHFRDDPEAEKKRACAARGGTVNEFNCTTSGNEDYQTRTCDWQCINLPPIPAEHP